MYTRIESADNRKLKLIRKLSSRKHRDALGKYVIEGINLVEEAIRKNADIEFVVASEDFESDRLDAISGGIGEIHLVGRDIYEKISDTENGSGVIAVVRRSYDRDRVIASIDTGDNVLVLDRVQDPGNIGTMIRTAVAAGYRAVLLIKGCADIYSPKVLRATAGMIFNLPVLFADDASEAVSILHELGLRVFVTEPEAKLAYYETDLSSGAALVIGNEGRGVSEELASLADERITLPMEGSVESLNAAVAAAILMYERIRRKTLER